MSKSKLALGVLALSAAIMVPAVVGAATTDNTTTKTTTLGSTVTISTYQTNVNGVLVPGYYVFNADSRVAYIPGGVGLVVVDKSARLPVGAYFVNK